MFTLCRIISHLRESDGASLLRRACYRRTAIRVVGLQLGGVTFVSNKRSLKIKKIQITSSHSCEDEVQVHHKCPVTLVVFSAVFRCTHHVSFSFFFKIMAKLYNSSLDSYHSRHGHSENCYAKIFRYVLIKKKGISCR